MIPVFTNRTRGGMRQKAVLHRTIAVLAAVGLSLAMLCAAPAALASAPTVCGTSSVSGTTTSVSFCLSVPSTTLTALTQVSVTQVNPASSAIQFTWVPSSNSCLPNRSGSCYIAKQFGANPGTASDDSFVWPTQKYLDGIGTLQGQAVDSATGNLGNPISVTGLALSNGNVTTTQQQPNDWQSFLPANSWTGSTDPTIAAVGDGADNQNKADAVANSIGSASVPLLLYLGDVYEKGSYSEMLNHYGWNATDGPCTNALTTAQCGSLGTWGQLGAITQPTIGNHEYEVGPADGSAWADYWHQRPHWTNFTFANTLFIDLDCGPSASKCNFTQTSPQYNLVSTLLSNPHPPCVVAYWHIPALASGSDTQVPQQQILPMWTLLTDHGGTLVLNGHVHNMQILKPLNDQMVLPSSGQSALTEVISGAGGHSVAKNVTTGSRTAWALATTPGALYLTLNGAANGGTPTSITYAFRGTNGQVLTNASGNPGTGTVQCGRGGPQVTTFSPSTGLAGASVTINGSGFTGTTSVTLAGLAASSFTVIADTSITATTPAGNASGPVCVTTPAGTGCSSSTFIVDNTSPSKPGTPTAINVAQTSLSLNWTASTDTGSGVDHYNLKRCAPDPCTPTKLAKTLTNSFNDSGLSPGTSYDYQVQAVDRAGNASANSGTLVVTTHAAGTPALVQKSPATSGNGTAASASFGAATAAGHLLVATISSATGNTGLAALPPGWAVAQGASVNAATIAYCPNCASVPANQSLAFTLNTAGNWTVTLLEYSNVSTLDQAKSATSGPNATSTEDTGTTPTTTASSEVVVAVLFNGGGELIQSGSLTSGYTLETQTTVGSTVGAVVADQVLTGAGAQRAIAGIVTPAKVRGAIATFK